MDVSSGRHGKRKVRTKRKDSLKEKGREGKGRKTSSRAQGGWAPCQRMHIVHIYALEEVFGARDHCNANFLAKEYQFKTTGYRMAFVMREFVFRSDKFAIF